MREPNLSFLPVAYPSHELGSDRRFAIESVHQSTLLSTVTVTINFAVLRWWM